MSAQQGTSTQQGLLPGDVFTPALPVRPEMFASRREEDIQNRVESVLRQPGRQLILYGPTGVGKTSLINHLAETHSLQFESYGCGSPFNELLHAVLADLVGEEVVDVARKRTSLSSLRMTLLKIFGGERSTGHEEQVASKPHPQELAKLVYDGALNAGWRFIFFDNFDDTFGHEHSDETLRSFAHLLKHFSDRALKDRDEAPKIVLAGIKSAASEFLALDDATRRRTAQIEVPTMPDDELAEILDLGGKLLGLSFSAGCRNQIVEHSGGFPYYTHLMGLHIAEKAIATEATTIDHFDEALDTVIADCDLTLARRYEAAIEPDGNVRPKKGVMEALALLDNGDAPFHAISRYVRSSRAT